MARRQRSSTCSNPSTRNRGAQPFVKVRRGGLAIRILVALTIGLTLVSCTASSSDPASTDADEPASVSTPTATPSTSGRSGAVERDFLRRPTLPSCGSIDLPNGTRANREDRARVECFREGMLSTAGAELAVVNYTVEGDPIRTYYRAEAKAQRLRVFVDTTDDSFAGFQGWRARWCRGSITPVPGRRVSCVG